MTGIIEVEQDNFLREVIKLMLAAEEQGIYAWTVPMQEAARAVSEYHAGMGPLWEYLARDPHFKYLLKEIAEEDWRRHLETTTMMSSACLKYQDF